MLVIGISGGSGSGKTTICNELAKQLTNKKVAILNQDSYYKDNKHVPPHERKKLNFDHPDALDFDLLIDHTTKLKTQIPVEKPDYSFITNSRTDRRTFIEPPEILIVEGILVFFPNDLRNLFDHAIFIETDEGIMLKRISERDKIHRGRSEKETETRFKRLVMPMYREFVIEGKRNSDITFLNNNDIDFSQIIEQINNSK